ncbi:MAG TPA: hypothetical protein DCS93_19010 [Microscillaceae bacterium]|nr:hypothetical protein [Microscillaceae bacterium]
MKKYSLLLLLAPLVFAIASCKKKDENNLTPEQVQEAKLIASQWKATGIYATGSNTPLQTFNLTLDFKDGNGTATNVDNTIIVNGLTNAPLTTQWQVNADGTLLTMKIPSASSILSAGTDITAIVTALVSAPTTELKITLSDTDLVIFGESGKDINVFGIPLPAGAELRFNKTGVATDVPTNSLLTAVTWKGEGVYTNGIKSSADITAQTMKFGTNLLGLNTVTISGVPAPVTWSINDAANPTQLTLIFPQIGNVASRTETFAISTLSSTNLNLKGTSSTKVNIVITELDVNTELRMVPQ